MKNRREVEIRADQRRTRGFKFPEGTVEKRLSFMQHHGARLQEAQQVLVVGDDHRGSYGHPGFVVEMGGENQVLDMDLAAGVQPRGGFVIRTETELTRREMLV